MNGSRTDEYYDEKINDRATVLYGKERTLKWEGGGLRRWDKQRLKMRLKNYKMR
jgi:hypothetical protein